MEFVNTSNLNIAFLKARKGKRFRENIVLYYYFLEINLELLEWLLKNNKYYPLSYNCFKITDPKERKIAAPNFRDRILQHLMVKEIEQIFEKDFIVDSYACRKSKGTHFALKRVKKFLQATRSVYGKNTEIYFIKMDVEKYFKNISWDRLVSILENKIKSREILDILRILITKYSFIEKDKNNPLNKEMISRSERKGIPIGNLTSQLFANIYLNEMDRFIKKELKVRWYGRYMDDFVIIHRDKKYLWELKRQIEDFLKTRLELNLHPSKTVVGNVKNGLPFVGYLIFYDHVLIRGDTLLRMRRKLSKKYKNKSKKFVKSSIKGQLLYANAYGLFKKMDL